MSEIFQRLNQHLIRHGYQIPKPYLEETKEWQFSPFLDRQDTPFFSYFVDHIESMSIEYSIHRAQLVALMKTPNRTPNDLAEGYEQVKTLLMLSELLERVYRDYLIVPRETRRLQIEQVSYRRWLRQDEYQFPDEAAPIESSEFSPNLRKLTQHGNFPRNVFARCWRLLRAIPPLLEGANLQKYQATITLLEQYIQPIIAYAAWIFFLPRLLTNLFLIAKHTLPHPWMGHQERNLGWTLRLKTQLKRRRVELANDLTWMTLGLLNCFHLVGIFVPIGSVIVLTLDVINSVIRFSSEVSRLEKLQKKYKDMLDHPNRYRGLDHEQTKHYLAQIKLRITYEKKQLSLQVANTSLLLVAFLFTGLLFAVNPILAITCASLAIAATLVNFTARRNIEKLKPKDTIPPKDEPSPLVRQSFFQLRAGDLPLPVHSSRSHSHFNP